MPPVATKTFSGPPNRCFSHGHVTNRGFAYSTDEGHVCASLSKRIGLIAVYSFFVLVRRECLASNLSRRNAANLHR